MAPTDGAEMLALGTERDEEEAEMSKFTLTFAGVTAVQMARLIRMGERVAVEPVITIDNAPLTVSIVDNGPNRIHVIKAIRELAGMGLKEAKDITEIEPRIVETGCSPVRAEEIRAALAAAGATVRVV